MLAFIIRAFGRNENSPCDVPGQDDFIFVPVKKSIKPTVCDPNIETGAIPLKQTPCIHNLNGKNYTVLRKQKSKNYVQWEFCRDVRQQKFNGHNCIINDLSANNGKCISIEALHTAIRDGLAAQPFVYNQTVDNTIEYKRYIVKYRAAMYDKFETLPSQELFRQMVENPFNMERGAWLHGSESNKYQNIFLYAADKLNYPEIKDHFTIDTKRNKAITYPAKHLCDSLLTYLPISNTDLLNQISIQDCPNVIDPTPTNDHCPVQHFEFPATSEFVDYDKNKRPKGCGIKFNHADFQNLGALCLSFADAEKLLNTKNNLDEDVEPGHSRMMENEDPFASSARSVWRNTTEGHYRRNYMAGVLRLHQKAHQPAQYYKPEEFYWSTLRSRNIPIQQILLNIEAALGYGDGQKREFTIKNPWNQPAGPVKVNLSVNAFCRAMLEMIPFSRQDLRNANPQ
uniref:Uncharacterized protein n=1 Tax=Romanomermis culicivorax TaxID=13658 RepID=A0A915HMG0_ROMCU